MFRLTKWYLDLVTDRGTVLIAYVASLEWAGPSVEFASTFLARPGSAPEEHRIWSAVRPPDLDQTALRFRHDGLGFAGEWRRQAPAVEATLLDDAMGRLHWACHFPSAIATVELRGERLNGRGYAECLTLTRPPWTLPLNQLRWGRWTAAAGSLVWIGWSGRGPPRQWVWLDGIPEPEAILGEDVIAGLSGGRELGLTPMWELCDRRALEVLSRKLPALETLIPGPVGNLRETKRLDRGALRGSGGPGDEGWVIREVVSWG